MIGSRVTANLFTGLIVLTSTILIVIMVYFLIRFTSRRKNKVHLQQDFEPRLLDLESGCESRLSYRLSRQQTQQDLREDLLQHFSTLPRPPSIELLPEIKTSSSDDRASEWLERGITDKGIDVVDGDLGEKRTEMRQAAVVKSKKRLRWECKDGDIMYDDRSSEGVENTDGKRRTQYGSEKQF